MLEPVAKKESPHTSGTLFKPVLFKGHLQLFPGYVPYYTVYPGQIEKDEKMRREGQKVLDS